MKDHAILSPIEAERFKVFSELGDKVTLWVFELKLYVGYE